MCAKADPVASGFSISGLLDSQAKVRDRYPVVEIDTATILDHPSNAVYSMDEGEIEKLAQSIEQDGLTDLPLVRKLPDGQWQMLSGHRRKAAFTLLSAKDKGYDKMPCRVVDSIDDAQALVLLHTANLFTRQLTMTERAAASRALGVEVDRMRETDPTLKGQRTEDIKASIISRQTGSKVSGKTIKRQEAMAAAVARLGGRWEKIADRELLSAEALKLLESMDDAKRAEALVEAEVAGMTKRELTVAISQIAQRGSDKPDRNLIRAEHALSAYMLQRKGTPNRRERELIDSLRLNLAELEGVSEHPEHSFAPVRSQS